MDLRLVFDLVAKFRHGCMSHMITYKAFGSLIIKMTVCQEQQWK